MGAAAGQVPEYTEMITQWCKDAATVPVMVKLTPNVTDIRAIGRAAKNGGADAISLINTVNSIMGVDLDTLLPKPHVAGRGSHGGYCGPAVKPIALHMVSAIANDEQIQIPISGIGGIQAWQDAAEFMLLGAGSVQICTAAMHYGFRIIEPLVSGLRNWMRKQDFASPDDFVGKSSPKIREWSDLDLAYKVVAQIDQSKCIHCGVCYAACEDGCHQSIKWEKVPEATFVEQTGSTPFKSGDCYVLPGAGAGYVGVFTIDQDACVGCNMCSLVCPAEGCITMKPVDSGLPSMNWNEYQKKLAAGQIGAIQPPQHI